MSDLTDEELLDQLGIKPEKEKPAAHSAREERVIAGFEDIQRFVDKHGRRRNMARNVTSSSGSTPVRLDRLRELEDCRTLLLPLDRQGLVASVAEPAGFAKGDDDAARLAQLGVDEASGPLGELRHVRSAAEKRVADAWPPGEEPGITRETTT